MKKAAASGHEGRPPITASELMLNSKIAQSKTTASTKLEKVRVDKEKNPQAIRGNSESSAGGGSITIAGRDAADMTSCGSME